MNETDLMNEIRIELTCQGFCVFRANVGKVRKADGSYFDSGLPVGFSDLFAVKNGQIFFIEVKVKPNKPSKAQLDFLKAMRQYYGCAGGVAYSVKEALDICQQRN